MTDRETFLAERKKGVGGSDIASVFSVGYGCRRRLFYDKRNVPKDFPDDAEGNDAKALGAYLEPYFAEMYAAQTGREVTVRPEPAVHPIYPELRVNVDRMIDDPDNPDRDPGVLELKAVGRAVFYQIKREGLPGDYILQLQHGMLVTGATWGAFGIGSRDSGQLLRWDVPRDNLVCELIEADALAFWQQVQTDAIPDRLEPDDHRCQKCEYRRSCQGAALIRIEPQGELERDETLRPILTEYLERKKLSDEAEELLLESKEQLKTQIGARQQLEVAGHKIYFRPQVSMRGDFKALAAEYDRMRSVLLALVAEKVPELGPVAITDEFQLAESFRQPSDSRPLRVY